MTGFGEMIFQNGMEQSEKSIVEYMMKTGKYSLEEISAITGVSMETVEKISAGQVYGANLEINKNLTKNPFLLLDSGKIKCYNIARTKEAGNNRSFRNSENDFLMIFLSRQVYTGEGGT